MPVVVSEGQLVTLATTTWAPSRTYGGLSLYGAYDADYYTMYKSQPAIRTVVDFLAKNIAQLGIKAYRRISDNERAHLPDHPLGQLLRNPHPSWSRSRFMRTLVSDIALYDRFFAYIARAGDSRALVHLPAPYVEPKSTNPFRVESFVWTINGKEVEFSPDDIFYVHGYNPTDDLNGVPPMETLRRILAEEAAAGEYREYFWKNRARSEVALRHPGTLSKPAAERLKRDFDSRTTGAENSGGTVVLEEGLDIKELSFNAQQSQYVESRKLSREEAAAAFHISPALLGMSDQAPYGSIDAHHRYLYQDALGPWTVWIEEEFELQLLPEFDDSKNVYVEFNLQEKLKGDFESQARANQAAVGAPTMTRNEARSRMNLPPHPDGDGLVTPLNVLIGGQASPLDSAPPYEPLAASLNEVLGKMRQAFLSRLGAGDTAENIYDRERWKNELAGILGAEKAEAASDLIETEVKRALGFGKPALLKLLENA